MKRPDPLLALSAASLHALDATPGLADDAMYHVKPAGRNGCCPCQEPAA